MESVLVPRWASAFVVQRWRFLFWLLPLAGLLIGLKLSFDPSARGVVLVTVTPSSTEFLTVERASAALVSDEVLGKTNSSLGLASRWGADLEETTSRLRRMIRRKEIQGTTLLEIRVTGIRRAESIHIWKTIVDEANTDLEQTMAADFEKRASAVQGLVYPGPYLQPLLSVLKPPDPPPPSTAWERHRPLILRVGYGTGSGILLAAMLAYLLELVFPRRPVSASGP